jgi:hypothetical protein
LLSPFHDLNFTAATQSSIKKIIIMKKLFTLTVLLAITCVSICQDANTETLKFSKADYLKKSRGQKIAGWCFAGTGTALLAGTLIVQATEDVGTALWYTVDPNTPQYDQTNYTGYYVAGAVVLATGIAFLAASKVNKNKANAFTAQLKMERSKQIINATGTVVNYPALSLCMRL